MIGEQARADTKIGSREMGMFFIGILLLAIVWLLWLNYQTLDGFNEDLKQLRILVAQIERHSSGEPTLPIEGPSASVPQDSI